MRAHFPRRLRSFSALAGALGSLLGATGCLPTQAHLPPGVPPTPTSISKDEPGGDADNPEMAALERLGQQSWGARNDRQNALLVPLPDSANWRRVTFWLVPTFAGFRYGDDHHAVAAVFVREAPSPDADSAACMRDFEQWAVPIASSFGVKITPGEYNVARWRGQNVLVHRREGAVVWALSEKEYAAVYAAYVPWPGACATVAYGFPMKASRALAERVRDRFADEAFVRFFSHKKPAP